MEICWWYLLFVWRRDYALKLLDFINTLHPSIKFDMKEEKDGKLEFLDTLITRDSNSAAPNVSTNIQKTDKCQFYHFPPSFRNNTRRIWFQHLSIVFTGLHPTWLYLISMSSRKTEVRTDQEIRFIESILQKYDNQNLNACERCIPLEIV